MKNSSGSDNALSMTGVSKAYVHRGKSVAAIREVDLTIRNGTLVALLGLNGAGKSTLVRMASGLLTPDEGSISIAGLPQREAISTNSLGVLLEGNRALYWRLTALENLLYFGAIRGMARARAKRNAELLLGRLDLFSKRDALVHTLSRGMQQRLSLAIAMLSEPRLLILDEPTLGLDVESVSAISRYLRELTLDGVSILLTSHQTEFVLDIADRVALLSSGQIVADENAAHFANSLDSDHLDIEIAPGAAETLPEILRSYSIESNSCVLRVPQDLLTQTLRSLDPNALVRIAKKSTSLSEALVARMKGVASYA